MTTATGQVFITKIMMEEGAGLELLKETADPNDNRHVTRCSYDGVQKPFNIPVHWHKHHDEHITVIRGRITTTIDGKDIIAKAGDPPLVIPRLHLHGFRGFPGESCVFEERNLPPGDYEVLLFYDLFRRGGYPRFWHFWRSAWDGDGYPHLPFIHSKLADQLLVLVLGGIGKLVCAPAPKSFEKVQ